MKTLALLILLAATCLLPATEHEKSVYRTHKVSAYVVRVECSNGADPTVVTDPRLREFFGNGLVVSCGDMRHRETLQSK